MQSMGYGFSATHITGYPLGLVSHSKYRAMWNWSNYCWWGNYGQIILRVIFDCGRIGYHICRVWLVSDIHKSRKKWTYNLFIFCSMLFYQIILGGISWHMKPMPVIFLFSASRESLSQTWNYYWNPCLVIKWSNVVKSYIISIPTPVTHWILWSIDIVKIVELEFVRKNW